MADFAFWYTLVLIMALIVVMIMEWIEVEIAMFATLIFLLVGDVITLDEAFQGFSNTGTLAIGLLFVVAGAMYHTGAIARISHVIFGKSRSGITSKLIRVMFPLGALSAFMNNTPLVAIMIPATRIWAERNQYSPSKFLIPISYAATLGGMCTLIGTSTNLIIHGLLEENGLQGLGFFELSLIGVPIAVLSIFLIALVGHHLLPNRQEPIERLSSDTREYVTELQVQEKYSGIGKTISEAGLRHLNGLFLFQIERDGELVSPHEDEKILLHDRLFFSGVPRRIMELQRTPGLLLIKDALFDLKQYDSANIKTYEAVVSPSSPLVGQVVWRSDFRERYEAVIIGVHRHGRPIESRIGEVTFHPGDTLLLLADQKFHHEWYHSEDFFLVSQAEEVPSKPQWQAWFSVSALIGMVLLTTTGVIPLGAAAGLAVVMLLLSRSITSQEAFKLIDWGVLVLVASAFGVAAALKNSGIALFVSEAIVSWFREFGHLGVITGVYIATSLFNLIMPRYATAALLFPVAILAASSMQMDPRPLAMAVAFAASVSLASPVSSPPNLMVFGPGGYKFRDFLRIGLPLQVIVGVLVILSIYNIYL